MSSISVAADETTESLDRFRRETRAWLEANCPAEMRQPVKSEADVCWGGKRFKFQSEAQAQWMQRMGERGWTVPTWPRDYGGGGLTHAQAAILREEMAALKCRAPLQSFGIWMLGPALLKYGSEQQKRENLPAIARGEIRWCQGYSEPNAGSDLASLATRAEVHDDHFVVSGQKVWTSYADEADWIFCLVRTDTAKKHTGISFVLIDMTSPGVSTRPIKLISGKSPFCETFFDQREGAARQPGGGAERRLDHRQVPADARARNDRCDRRALDAQAAGAPSPPSGWAATRPGGSPTACCAPRSRASRSTRRRFAPGLRLAGEQARAGEAHPRFVVGAQVLRRRAQQAALGIDDGRRRSRCAGVGRRALAGRRRRAHLAAHQGQFDRGRHERSAAQRGGQAHARPARRMKRV